MRRSLGTLAKPRLSFTNSGPATWAGGSYRMYCPRMARADGALAIRGQYILYEPPAQVAGPELVKDRRGFARVPRLLLILVLLISALKLLLQSPVVVPG